MTRIELPFPPSTWDLYVGWGLGRRLSSSYRAWRDDCGWLLKKTDRIEGPFSIDIALKRPHKRMDLDNRAKAILDCLQTHGIIKNDNLNERMTMQWDAGLPADCVVILQPFEGQVAA